MTWVETVRKTYMRTGLQAPVFLCPDMNDKRVFIDIQNGHAELEYSYDPIENFHLMGNDMSWQKLESGAVENDFAVQLLGVHALRLKVVNIGDENVRLQVFEKKAEKNDAR